MHAERKIIIQKVCSRLNKSRRITVFLFFALWAITSSFQLPKRVIQDLTPSLSSEEMKLYELIMAYRKEKKLPPIPLSTSLTYVAQMHCKDLFLNKPHVKSGCNLHSWSSKGKWSSCCYTLNHKEAHCMWDKPKELTNYPDKGFEIACSQSNIVDSNLEITATHALDSWKKSNSHNDVLLNKTIWKDVTWKAIGVGIHKGFATVWFGQSADKEGEMEMKSK